MTDQTNEEIMRESEAVLDGYLKQQFPRTFNILYGKDLKRASNYLKARKKAGIFNLTNIIQGRLLKSPLAIKPGEMDFNVYDNNNRKVRVNCSNARNSRLESIHTFYVRAFYEDQLPKEFLVVPNSSMPRHIREKASALELDDYGESKIYFPCTHYVHDKHKSRVLLGLADLFGNPANPITPDNAIKTVREKLQGKKIISLGDDTGSLSEILASFDCKPFGIEYDAEKVAIARTGFFSEDGKPNEYVRLGDIWDLLLPGSVLYKEVGENQYDAIASVALFNSGSGGEMPMGNIKERLDKMFNTDPDYEKHYGMETIWMSRFISGSEIFLKEDGVQLHTDTDINPSPEASCHLIRRGDLYKYRTS